MECARCLFDGIVGMYKVFVFGMSLICMNLISWESNKILSFLLVIIINVVIAVISGTGGLSFWIVEFTLQQISPQPIHVLTIRRTRDRLRETELIQLVCIAL